jgi:hypothetical protein
VVFCNPLILLMAKTPQKRGVVCNPLKSLRRVVFEMRRVVFCNSLKNKDYQKAGGDPLILRIRGQAGQACPSYVALSHKVGRRFKPAKGLLRSLLARRAIEGVRV